MNNLVISAKDFASRKHREQVRRNGRPYIEHCREVSECLDSDILKAIGWLHDVMEDCRVTVSELNNAGFPTEVVEAVFVLSKKTGETYSTYLERVVENRMATQVKIADVICNLTDEPSNSQVDKYKSGLLYLFTHLQNKTDNPPPEG